MLSSRGAPCSPQNSSPPRRRDDRARTALRIQGFEQPVCHDKIHGKSLFADGLEHHDDFITLIVRNQASAPFPMLYPAVELEGALRCGLLAGKRCFADVAEATPLVYLLAKVNQEKSPATIAPLRIPTHELEPGNLAL